MKSVTRSRTVNARRVARSLHRLVKHCRLHGRSSNQHDAMNAIRLSPGRINATQLCATLVGIEENDNAFLGDDRCPRTVFLELFLELFDS